MFSASRKEKLSPAQRRWDDAVEPWEQVAASPAFQRLKERILTVAAPRWEDHVVDLGAGTGLLALSLAPLVESVTAVDASNAMLERLADRAATQRLPNVTTVAADLRTLPLPDESATLVVSNYAFHHLDDAGKALALSEARRVLAPGGRLVVCDMMFALTLSRRDRAIVASKIRLLLRQGPAGLVRLSRNAFRLAAGRWEQPAPAERWRDLLTERRFASVTVETLAHEGGIAYARRPRSRVAEDRVLDTGLVAGLR